MRSLFNLNGLGTSEGHQRLLQSAILRQGLDAQPFAYATTVDRSADRERRQWPISKVIARLEQ